MHKKRTNCIYISLIVICSCVAGTACTTNTNTTKIATSHMAIDITLERRLDRAINDYERGFYMDAREVFEQMAEAPYHNPLALYYLGHMYLEGKSVPQSSSTARSYYARSFQALESPSRQGYPQYQFALGISYLEGKGTKPNFQEGMKWIERSAQQSFPKAQIRYGLYLKEQNLNPIAYFEAAARQNDPKAQTLLAREYLSNEYVETNPSLATSWLEKAAEANDMEAQYALANMYSKNLIGIGVTSRAEDAVYWYERAASNGNKKAFYILGHAYQKGIGTKMDLIKAYAFYMAGSILNSTRTKEKALNLQGLQTIRLTYYQRLEANALAKLFLSARSTPN